MQVTDTIRTDIYLMLASLFRAPPSQSQLQFLADLGIEDNSSVMSQCWLALRHAAQHTDIHSLEEEYQWLFIGIGRGEVVPFASWHLTGSLMEKPLADLRQHMAQLGLQRSDSVKEPEDHIAALCESMAWLISDMPEQQGEFFHRHISSWFNHLAQQIEQAEHANFYRAVSQVFKAFLSLESIQMTPASIASQCNTHVMHVKNTIEQNVSEL
ncbi:molecular chaperone [Vibrio sp. V31_P5A7T61]|uniref:TorD/DmsD family molecular chaperone n=1 Tax=unclassified Vibrio TaxID=2614977 RepID=UPI0013731F84|nr:MULTISPECIES: molecular chaperone [unclassified Vibrio]NAW62385.1 molecular chaperone [Vibrio sp. V31_P5A7T61]NAX01546.1 molecular chaperone [Vibrio sp. V34_P3A8T189]NAX07773.1 molecular chaperone [Vibrio sp. V40_P2S30T141]NAX63645.1 molecular chaperone [Vibrio sp. V32_P6A28T40]